MLKAEIFTHEISVFSSYTCSTRYGLEKMAKRHRKGQSSIWEVEEFEAVLNELSMPHKLIIAICFYTDARVSEARQLRAGDIGKKEIYFRKEITKGRRWDRAVPISTKLRALLEAAELPQEGYLFKGRVPGKPVTRQAVDAALRQACSQLGLEGYSTHSGRRSFATRLDKNQVRLKTIAELGGWKSLGNLAAYLEISPEELEQAVESQ